MSTGNRIGREIKFAESPEIVQLIGTRLSSGQALTDNRLGLGDQIVTAMAGAAAAVGTAAGLAIDAVAKFAAEEGCCVGAVTNVRSAMKRHRIRPWKGTASGY